MSTRVYLLISIFFFLGLGRLLGIVSPAFSQEITVSTAGQYSSGDYIFTESTDLFSWSNGLTLTQGRLQVGVTVPLLVQTTPWITYGGIGPTPSGGPQSRAIREGRGPRRGRRAPIALPDTGSTRTTGVGDPQIRVSYDVRPLSDTSRLRIQLLGTVKPPLADADAGFSTGAWDGGVGLSVSRSFLPWFVLAEGAYWWLGDLDDLPLEENLTYSVAVGRSLYGGQWGILASLTGSTTVIDGVDPPVALNGGLTFSPGWWGLSATVSSGLTEGTADWSAGLGAFVTFQN